MKIILNGRFGGPDHNEIIHPLIVRLRKVIKEESERLCIDSITPRINYTIFANGEISTYYNETGVFKPRYYKLKSEIKLDLSLANNRDIATAATACASLKSLFIQSIEEIKTLVAKKNIDINITDLSTLIESAFCSITKTGQPNW